MCQPLIDSLFCTECFLQLGFAGSYKRRERNILCTDFVVTEDKIGQDLREFCSDLWGNDRFHDFWSS